MFLAVVTSETWGSVGILHGQRSSTIHTIIIPTRAANVLLSTVSILTIFVYLYHSMALPFLPQYAHWRLWVNLGDKEAR